MKKHAAKYVLSFVCVFAIISSLFLTLKPFAVHDSGDEFTAKLLDIYREYTPDIESYDTEKEPFALARICATEYNGKRYGAKEVVYDKESDFAVLQYDNKEDAERAVIEMQSDGVIAEPDGIATLDESEKGTMNPAASEALGTTTYMNNIAMSTDETVVAVIDTGVMYDHPAIADRFYSHGIDMSEDGEIDAYYDTTMQSENYYHSTAVCGVIADNTPDSVKLLPIKIVPFASTTSYSSLMVNAINKAVNSDVDIINISMSANTIPSLFENAVNYAYRKGVIVCASMGNNGIETVERYPACCEKAFGISALESDFETVATFSNYSEAVDFTAPGRKIRSTYVDESGASFNSFSGTSFSTPYIAALCADIKCINSALNRDEIYQILTDFSLDLGDEGFDKYFGYGMPVISDMKYTDGENYIYRIPQGTLDISHSMSFEKGKAPWYRFAPRLIEVNIDPSVKDVGDYMFYGMIKANFNMPETFDSVGAGAFNSCKKLESMKFDIDVKSIGNYAFAGIDGFVIKGYRNTPAEEYALREKIDFFKLGCKHEYVYEVYEPTSYRAGYTLYTCLICNDSEVKPYRKSKVLESGSCGENLTYTIYENGKLYISGEGDMKDYFGIKSPFYNYRDIIKVLEIGDGVSSVSPFAFYGCNLITKINCIDNPYLKCDGTGLIQRDSNKLVFVAAKGVFNMPESVESFDATAFIIASNTVINPNSRYHIEDNIIFDGNNDIVVALPNYNERVLTIERTLKIYPYAFLFTPYPEVVDTKQLNVEAGSFSLGFNYAAAVKRHSMTFKLGNKSKLFMYAINNNFDIEYYNLGVAGEDITWEYIEDEQALYFYGTGDMTTYESVDELPWKDYLESLKKLVIDERITSLSPYAFNGVYELEELSIPVSIKPFEDDTTFEGAYYLKRLTITCGSGYSGDYVTDDGVHLYRNTPWYMSRKSIASYSIDEDIKYIGKEMFRNSLFITSLSFNRIEEIGEDAFIACTNFVKLTNKCKTTVYNPYSVFSYNIGNKKGIYANKTLSAYSDSTSKDYTQGTTIAFVSLGCAHSRNVEEVSGESAMCCREKITYLCHDCENTFDNYVLSGDGHSVKIRLSTTVNKPLKNASVSLDGKYFAECDEYGRAEINGVYCGNYTLKVLLYGTEIYSCKITVDGEDMTKVLAIRYADFVRDGVINAKDYAYSLKHGYDDAELFDYGRVDGEN